jgi:hypothetical protein
LEAEAVSRLFEDDGDARHGCHQPAGEVRHQYSREGGRGPHEFEDL